MSLIDCILLLIIVDMRFAALNSLKGPAPSLEAYANYQAIAPPTVLRSERRQASKKEYLTGCAKLEEILEQALGLSESIPVPPATIISGLREMQEACRKRKRGDTPPFILTFFCNYLPTSFYQM